MENKQELLFNENEVLRYLGELSKYGIPHCELRLIENGKMKGKKKISTNPDNYTEVVSFITDNHFQSKTVNSTLNQLSEKSIESDAFVSDKDIEKVNFLFIDIDSEKAMKGESATNEELASAELLMEELSEFLDNNGVNRQIKIMSGNGYHLLIPIDVENVKSAVEINKRILKILSAKFSNEKAKIDTSVFNPSRLGKLVGTVASKGKSTHERPHRVSRIISSPDDNVAISEDVLKKFIDNHEKILESATKGEVGKTITEASSNYSDQSIDVELWLDSHNLSYLIKEGNAKGFQIFTFSKCPLKDHTNNSYGASLAVNREGKVQFKCLHHSHECIGINDFIDRYPIPENAKLNKVTEERLNKKQTFYFENFELNNKGLFIKKKEGSVKIASPLYISNVYQEEDTHIVSYELKYVSNSSWKSKHITGEQLQQSRFKNLVEYGVEFKSRYETDLVDFLQTQKQTLTPTLLHQQVGFKERDGELVYLLNDTIAQNSHIENSILKPNSYYNLSEKEYELWKESIQSLLTENRSLALGLSIGLVPFIIGFLSNKDLATPNLIVNLRGKSSTGKTTMLKLIGSIYGEPSSLALTMNATTNSLVHLAKNNNGVPLLLDELGSMQKNFNLSQLIFTLSSGQERLRLSKDIALRKQESFTTGTIITSEHGLDKYLDDTTGLYMRYLEFCDVPWCSGGKEAEFINEIVSLSYGGLIREVTSYVLNNQNLIVMGFRDSITNLADLIPEEHKLKSRLIKNVAIIQLAAKILNSVGFEVNIDYINEKLIEVYNHMLNLADKPEEDVYAQICETLVINANKFATSTNQVVRNGKCLGRVKISKEQLIVNVFKNSFELMLEKLEFSNPKTVINQLIEAEKLTTDIGRLTKRIRAKEGVIPTYQLTLPLEYAGYFGLDTVTYPTTQLKLPDNITRVSDTVLDDTELL
ncbi:DUF927 domain-containing protein [Vagococcus fluvialis]|uniref:DUF927 domain-containing protein n=1 Tax=Vagococcus fluvialis TaxID=2738 RepID=UPI002B2BCEA9|nr:DUF927 domain-containing protein [Vagococcus fluvialis]